jgi:acetyl-CoA acetyltransferase
MTAGELSLQAARRAMDEAGIEIGEVDGLAVYPNPSRLGAGGVDGIDFVGLHWMARSLGARSLRWMVSVLPGSFVGSVIEAANAVAAGACDTALVWRGMHNPEQRFGRFTDPNPDEEWQFLAPYGLADWVTRFAMPYSRYMAKYGATREQMATFVVNNRANAARNPDAVFFERPLTRDEYMNARLVTEPYCIFDCDMPIDGAGAVIVTSHEGAGSAKHPPVHVAGSSIMGANYRWSGAIVLEDLEDSAELLARGLWKNSPVGVEDIDQPNLYDGFSFFTYLYLEAFGFCPRGEAADFIQDGRIEVGGELPLNTSGGSLGMGRLHGSAQVIESVRQLQGRCGERQVDGARATMALSGQPHMSAAAMVLTRDSA